MAIAGTMLLTGSSAFGRADGLCTCDVRSGAGTVTFAESNTACERRGTALSTSKKNAPRLIARPKTIIPRGMKDCPMFDSKCLDSVRPRNPDQISIKTKENGCIYMSTSTRDPDGVGVIFPRIVG